MSRTSEPTAQAGFTLMELIGVMAIIAILASVVAPALTDGIDRAYGEAEAANLENFGAALERYVLANGSIPSMKSADWVPAIAASVAVAESQVAFNARGFERKLYADPRFFTTTDKTFNGYTQGGGLDDAPNSPRLLLVSSLGGKLPKAPTTGAAFNAIWDQTSGAAVVADNKVKIQRINFNRRFHRLVLTNASDQQGAFALGAQPVNPLPVASGGVDGMVERYVLETTQLKLYARPFPSGSLETSVLLRGAMSAHYVTDGSRWYWERS